ncbi:MAG: ABC transporter substrate-binding protein [Polyangiaceae bacterium]|nr:ABC transporter substrate-binding protein [Polyangiaceae bacterium]
MPAIAGLVACGRADTSGDASEPPVEVVASTEVATLDPRYSTRALDVKVTRLVHAGLVGLDPDSLEPVPLVARSVAPAGDDALRVELRDGVRFHSGAALGPTDVCATLEALADPALASPHRAVVRAIHACVPEGPLTVVLRFRERRASWVSDLEVPILRAEEARRPPAPLGELDGLGPFRVASAAPGVVHLAPAETGIAPRPRQGVVVRTVRDENARALRLLAGRADLAPSALSPAILPALEGRGGLVVRSRPGANVTYLLFQNDRAPTDRVEVRRAVVRAIDRARLAETLLGGRAQVASTMLPPGHWAHAADIPLEPYDPAASRAVLASLPPVTLLTSTDRARLVLARAVAQMLGDAGLVVRVVSLDLGVLLARLDAGDFELASLQLPELTEPNVLSWFFHPRGVPGEGGEGRNRARFRHPGAASLFDAAGATHDRAERRRLYGELQTLMARELPVAPLWHEDHVVVASPRAAAFRPSAEGRWGTLAAL